MANSSVSDDVSTMRDDSANRIVETERTLRATVLERGFWLSGDGRVGEADAAALLGWSAGALRNQRKDGTGPVSYRIGGGGHKITYRLSDLARWLEAGRN